MESTGLTLAPATKVLSPQTPEEINLLPLSLCLSAGLNRGHGPGRSSRVLHNVALMGCEDKQMVEMRYGSVMATRCRFTPGIFG